MSIEPGDELADHRCFDSSKTILDLFHAQVSARPAKAAIIEDGWRVSYEELAQRAAVFADVLQPAVGPGDRVAILARRGTDSVAAQLGVLSLGASFAPLDPRSPDAHLLTLVQELDPSAVVELLGDVERETGRSGFGDLIRERGRTIVRAADAVDAASVGGEARATFGRQDRHRVRADDPACILFTSGTTGRPKGVVLPHRGICRLVRGQDYADLGPDQVVLNVAPPGFDVCLSQVFSALLNGGTVAVVPGCVPSLDAVGSVIVTTGTTLADLSVGMFNLLVEHRLDAFASLTQVICGGDVISPRHAKLLLQRYPHLRLINAYGPTENSVNSCCYTLPASGSDMGPVPIGRAIAHDVAFVLDDALQPVPAGEIGELAVGGHGLALGYLGRPDLTSERFVDVDLPGYRGRLYRTGDLVRERSDGVLMFHGRLDRQVKINGFRVELDAVEHAVRKDPSVADAAVLLGLHADGSRRIVAVVRAVSPSVTAEDILARLRSTLPPALVPAQLLVRDALPLTATEKVDRRRLEAEIAAELAAAPRTAPAGPSAPPRPETGASGSDEAAVEVAVRAVWAEVLGLADVPSDRTFFDLGGSSLQLVEAHAALQRRLGRSFDIVRLFEAPHLRDVVALLSTEPGAPAAPPTSGPARPSDAETGALEAARRAAVARARQRSMSAR
jgi:amino acid adenylation domain-containing protein